jgi:hypothetical protein
MQIPKNFPKFYGTWGFITVFTRTLHWSISWARSIQSIPFYLISILILSTHLRLGPPSGLISSSFPTIIRYAFLSSVLRATYPAHLILPDLIILIILGKEYKLPRSMARPQVADEGDGLQIWRVAANILNKKSHAAELGWFSSILGVERGACNSSP